MGLSQDTTIKAPAALAGTAATYLWGGMDAVFTALVTLACLDYVCGLAAAWVKRRLSSDVGRRGIARKAGMFAIVALCNVIDQAGGLGGPVLRTMAVWWYIGNEALSIVENLAELGVPIPGRLRRALAVMSDPGGDTNSGGSGGPVGHEARETKGDTRSETSSDKGRVTSKGTSRENGRGA